ncbi:vWA domain-containing protein [Archaeoglobus veneficus]|uniref:von Willebrand factor type A n=1 Tax=Archaeoglobus veneficus (strain DSM 11195 / SNP6) TaxID=693661 RepID=F2KMY2_ARCVS|nr:VWA domain-containing protein [Archaeoglobus veneficus]AEA47258.1 von Willebrand factor type A [Archaeoglobus veneficus SNP6]
MQMQSVLNATLSNNLVNVTSKDFVYNLISQRIASFLPPDLQEIYNSSRHIQIIATDSYFLHYSLYPFLRGKNEDEVLEEVRLFCREYMDGERYQMLKTLTTLDDELSLVYSIALTKYIVGRIRGRLENEGEGVGKISGSGRGARVETFLKGISALLEGAVEEAENVTKNAEEIRELMGGKSAGREAGTFQKILNLAKQMMFVEDLKKIVDMSKRMMDFVPKATRISKVKGKTGDELSGYMITKQVERALPRELALPDELFMRRLASEGFLAREKLKVSEGAYYILIDKSGSMVGEKTVWARSVAMAIYRMSKTKRRKYFLRFFDTKVHPDKPISEPKEIVDAILKVQSNGGTDITNAISTAIDDLVEGRFAEYTNTIIVITDGEDVVDDLSKELKKTKASLISVMIQGNNDTLKNISDHYMHAELTERGGERLLRLVEVS